MSLASSREHDLDAERRRHATFLPRNAACEACGERDPLMLDGSLAMVLCADDAAIDQRRDPAERHHLGGRRWNIVLDLTPNWHRIVSALQRMRKRVTTGNVAELLYGIGDLIYAIADYVNQCEAEVPQ